MRRCPLSFLLLGLGTAACAAPPEHVEQTASLAQPIVGGWAAPEDVHVAALVNANGVICSGTLIAERVVITAAHCVELAPTAVRFEGETLAATVTVPIATFNIHPEFDSKTLDNDLAIITLLEPAPSSIAVPPIGNQPLPPELGGSGLRIVGFGRTSASAAAVRLQGWASIAEIEGKRLRTVPGPSQPCRGDSGGPAFSWIDGREVLVGVISSGDAACEDHAYMVRTDAFVASFINPMLAAVANGAARVGQRCFHPDNCVASATCFVGSAASTYAYCTQACEGGASCLPAMTCTPQVGGGSLCLFPRPPGETGAMCIVDTDCNSLHCARRGDVATCADTCIPHVIPCTGDRECLADTAHPDHYACFTASPRAQNASPAAVASVVTPWVPLRPPPTADSTGGCAIASGGHASTELPWLALALTALGFAQRRRRTA